MQPRASLLSWLVVLLAFLQTCAVSTCLAAETLRIGYILSRSSQLGAGAAAFCREVSERTGRRYRVEQYPDAMLGGEAAMIEAVRIDALDLAFVTGASLSTAVPVEGVFDIPYLFPDAVRARRTLDGPIGEEYLTKFESAGLVGLAWGENGMRQLTNSKLDVTSPTDLAGLKLRLPQSDAMAAGFEVMGASIERIPFNQLYGALQTKTVDAEENPIATIVAARFAQVQNHLTITNHVYDPAVILMSRRSYEAMTSSDREAMRQAARLGGSASRDTSSRMDADGIARLQAAGMSIVMTIDRSAFARAVAPAEPAWNKLYGAGEIARIRNYNLERRTTGGGADR